MVQHSSSQPSLLSSHLLPISSQPLGQNRNAAADIAVIVLAEFLGTMLSPQDSEGGMQTMAMYGAQNYYEYSKAAGC